MIHKKIETNDGAQILIWELTESLDELISELHLPENIAEYNKFDSDKRKKEFLAVRVALKKLLNREVIVIYDKEGKPFLSDNCFNISISHTTKWIAVMIHPSKKIGIDIECNGEKIKKIYTRFLNKAEQMALSNGENTFQLHVAWSAKEALYKIIGKDAVDFANQMQISPFELKEKGKINITHTLSEKKYELYYVQNTDYTLVYCVD